MKKLLTFLPALVLSTVIAFGGTIPVGGFCDSAVCIQMNQPVDGGSWFQIDDWTWVVMVIQ